MTTWEKDILDGFLSEASEEPGLPELLESLENDVRGEADSNGEPPVSPPAALRASLLGSLELEGRFDRFVNGVASLLHVGVNEAKALLDGIGEASNWTASPLPQLSLFHIDGGPEVADAITGFARMQGGESFPEHEHCGQESVLVLQGSLHDLKSGEVYRPGDVAIQETGSSHSFVACDGPDLVYLVVAQQGIMLGGQHFAADSPYF